MKWGVKMKKFVSLLIVVAMLMSHTMVASAYSFNNNGKATKKATAYRLPSVNSGEVWWVDKNDNLEVLCRDGDFYLVLYPFNNTGKHVISYVPISAVSTSGVPNAVDFYKNETVRTNSNTNVYHNPSTDKLIGASGSNQTVRSTVGKGKEVTILFEKDGFYCVRTGNDTGFIEKSKICNHKNTTKKHISSGKIVNSGNSDYHDVNNVYNEVCDTCAQVLKSNVSATEKEKHTYEGNVCSQCGYVKEDAQDSEEVIPETEFVPAPEKPSPSTMKASKTSARVGESVTFTWTESANTTAYNIHVGKDGKRIAIISDLDPDNRTYTYEFTGTGEYTFGIYSLNSVGEYVCGTILKIKVVETSGITEKPSPSTMKASKTYVKVGESVNFTWSKAANAAGYGLHIYKNGKRIELISGLKDFKYTYKFTSAGEYKVAIYTSNDVDVHTCGTIIIINVSSQSEKQYSAWVYKTGTDRLNVRSTPKITSGNIIGKLLPNQSVTVLGKTMQNGFYKIKYGSGVGYASAAYITFTKQTTTSTTTKKTTTSQNNSANNIVSNVSNGASKVSFIKNQGQVLANNLSAKKETALLYLDVVNSVSARTSIQKVLGVSTVAVATLDVTKLFDVFDVDAVIGIAATNVNIKYFSKAETSHNKFLSMYKNVTTVSQANAAFEYFREALAHYDAVLKCNDSIVREYSKKGNYTHRMLDTFFTAVADAAIPADEMVKLQKICKGATTTGSLISAVQNYGVGSLAIKETRKTWNDIWAKYK